MQTMRMLITGLILTISCGALAGSSAQIPAGSPAKSAATATAPAPATTAPPAAPAASPVPPGPSSILRPALDKVQQSVSSLKIDKWKRGTVRDEAGADIGSIVNDVQVNLPPLMKDGDSAPGTVSKLIPVVRNVDALYDVLLRVVEASRIAAPEEQVNVLGQALTSLSNARLSLYDQIVTAASTQEKLVVDLHATVQKQAAFRCPAPPPPPVCPAPAVHKARKKPAPAKPATTTPPAVNTPKPPTSKTGP